MRLAQRRSQLALAAAVVGVDQLTKALAHQHLPDRGVVELIPGFLNLWYSRNPGGLFSFFSDWPDPWRMLLLTLVPVAAIVLIVRFLLSPHEQDRLTLASLSLILGGAVGNLIDRLTRGEVIDFVDVRAPSSAFADWLIERFGTAHWPTFNAADSAIVIGSLLMLVQALRPVARERGAAAG